jgi:hypothetical protein
MKQARGLGVDVKSSFVAAASAANNPAGGYDGRSIMSCRTRSVMMSAEFEQGL